MKAVKYFMLPALFEVSYASEFASASLALKFIASVFQLLIKLVTSTSAVKLVKYNRNCMLSNATPLTYCQSEIILLYFIPKNEPD